jgi:hypothetical protein
VKRVRRDCAICRRNRAKPGEQFMGDLPDSWLDSGSLPLTRTAVYLLGPFEVGLARWATIRENNLYKISMICCEVREKNIN